MVLKSKSFPKPEGVSTLEEARQIIAQQSAAITALLARIEHLESWLAQNSRNSSKPPSSDGYNKPQPKSRRTKSGRPSGGQPGHKGTTLKAVEHPDETEILALQSCPRCGHSLIKQTVTGHVRRQVFDIPRPTLHVKEYCAEIKDCPCCKAAIKAEFPASVPQAVQYGPCLKASVVYLSHYQLLPYQRLQALLQDLFNVSISQGTIDTMLHRCHGHLEPHEEAVKTQLTQSPVAHFDETGMRMDKDLHWMHVCSTEHLTHYHFDKRRGTLAMDAMGILPEFKGHAVHDHWKPYYQYDCSHVLCNAHHLRELIHAHEQYGQCWAQKLIDCLLDAKSEVEAAIGRGKRSLPDDRLGYYQRRYSRVLREGRDALPTLEVPEVRRRGRKKQHPAKNLHDRLVRHKVEVMAYLYDFSMPFDNNLAERDLRMDKVKQKISGCFRSLKGAQVFARVRGYVSTSRKHSLNVFEAIMMAVKGQPFIPDCE